MRTIDEQWLDRHGAKGLEAEIARLQAALREAECLRKILPSRKDTPA